MTQYLEDFAGIVRADLCTANYHQFNKWGSILGKDYLLNVADIPRPVYAHLVDHLCAVRAEVEGTLRTAEAAFTKYGRMGVEFMSEAPGTVAMDEQRRAEDMVREFLFGRVPRLGGATLGTSAAETTDREPSADTGREPSVAERDPLLQYMCAGEHSLLNPVTGGHRCTVCYADMGVSNPRQLCAKTRCDSTFCHVCGGNPRAPVLF